MRVVQVSDFSGLDGVHTGQKATPTFGPREILVEVDSFGLSFADVLMVNGKYQVVPSLPATVGSDFSGTVKEIGSEVTRFTPGDRVAGFQLFGAGAEFVAISEEFVFPLPDNLPHAVAASLPINYLTAHFALHRRGQLEKTETVLIHGAAGGLGDAAVRLAKAHGARVIAVVSSELKADFARGAGADDTILLEQFPKALSDVAPQGIDLVIDPVGGELFHESLRQLARYGRVVTVGFASGGKIPEVKVNRLLLRNIDVRGASWAPVAEKDPKFAHLQWAEISQLIERGEIVPAVPFIYQVSDVADGLERIQNRQVIGKVVVTW